MTVREFLEADPVGQPDREVAQIVAQERLAHFLPASTDPKWLCALARFATDRPLRYWRDDSLQEALSMLEACPERTRAAFASRSDALGLAMHNLLVTSGATEIENVPPTDTAEGLDTYMGVLLPEYLRCAEGIYGHLLEVYWSVLKKAGPGGQYDARAATQCLKAHGCTKLLVADWDRIRNSIAHGTTRFVGDEIHFANKGHAHDCSAYEFMQSLDQLVESCMAMALACLLFLARPEDADCPATPPLPVIRLLLEAYASRPSLYVRGVYESHPDYTSRDLRIWIETPVKHRVSLITMCLRVCAWTPYLSAGGYDRVLFEFKQGRRVPALVIVDPKALVELLRTEAPADQVTSAILEPTMLLLDEPGQLRSARDRWSVLKAVYRQQLHQFARTPGTPVAWCLHEWCWIRRTQNISVGRLARLEVLAVLRHPDWADDRRLVREIVVALARKAASKRILTKGADPFQAVGRYCRPHHVIVRLYRQDGPCRALGRLGWAGGDLVAIAEYRRGLWPPNRVACWPDEVHRGVEIQYGPHEP
ncbi:MAG: hypothetical protein HZB16_07825 [Armatimonadetes bacterium]|nr:hypothetical protein [Armatimonadota bacterium]